MFTANRNRWYYFALANCESKCPEGRDAFCQGHLEVDYKVREVERRESDLPLCVTATRCGVT